MKYNLFFNLHIPRTGGTHFRENVLNKLDKILSDNNINLYNCRPEDTAHWCWFKPYIKEDTYIYTSLRDPVKRLISQFSWQAKDSILKQTTNYKLDDINKNNFYKWLEDGYDMYKNFQSKNLVYYNSDHSIYKAASDPKWADNDVPRRSHFLFSQDFINFKVNKYELLSNIKRINMIVDSKDLHDLNKQSNIINKMLQDMNIKNDIIIDQSRNINFSTDITENLFSTFTQNEINRLYEYQDLDSEIYFSNYFTEY